MIDLNDEALAFVADRRRRIDALLADPHAFGVGPDVTDPEVMRGARRPTRGSTWSSTSGS